MATFSRVPGMNPSSIDFKLATITQTRNSSVMHQEIISLGDPNSSLGIAECSSSVPTSTFVGLVTKEAGGILSSVGGVVTIQGNSTVVVSAFAAALQSSAAAAANSSALNVRVVGGASSGADFPVSIAAGNSSVTVAAFAAGYLSTAAAAANSSALNVRLVGGPSSAADVVIKTLPNSTLWASSAGFHFDSSGGLQISGSITATAGSTVSTGFIAVRISDGSTWVVDYLNGSTFTSSLVGGGANFLRAGAAAVASSDVFVIPWGSTLGHTIIAVTDSSNAVVSPGDSANNALRVNVIAGATAGPVSSAAPAGNSSALVVRIAGGPSSAADCAINVSSVAGVLSVSPNSTAWVKNAGFSVDSSNFLNVNASFTGSTIVTVSAFGAGLISSAAAASNSSALLVRVVGGASSAVDNPVRAVLSSTSADNPVLATIGTNLQSTTAPSSNSSGLIVRQVIDARVNAASTSAFATSTQFTISGSTAQQKYVTAYSITSTDLTASVVRFMGGSTLAWPVRLQAMTSGVTGANLAVGTGYIFKTDAASSLTLNVSGSSRGGWTVAVSYYLAP